jgi:acyl carrier protein
MAATDVVHWGRGMDMPGIEQQLKEILCEVLNLDEIELTPAALLTEDLGMDSLDRAELTIAIEEQLLNGELMDEATADGWQTVEDVVNTVTRLTRAMR